MFERRLKIILGIIIAMAGILLVRAGQLQLVQKKHWVTLADNSIARPALIETARGRIYDRKNHLIAWDAACIDVAVDFRAISLDAEWIKKQAKARLKNRADFAAGIARDQLLADEIERVKADIDEMWAKLAQLSGKSPDEIEEIRQEVLRKVAMPWRYAWYRHFARTGGAKERQGPSPWYKRWLVDAKSDDAEEQHAAAVDAAHVVIGEQVDAHVILRDVSNDVQIELGKNIQRYPGLVLRENMRRKYDDVAAKVACHIIGRLAGVSDKDVTDVANQQRDPLRAYLPLDLIGREGIEGLAEPILRGSKGRLLHYLGRKDGDEIVAPIPGEDAIATIDLKLQEQILRAFKEVVVHDENNNPFLMHDLHGAAVVIDVRSSEVLAMASYPTFDLKRFDEDYEKLSHDDIDRPLLNRATMVQCEPGSTVKPIIGATAVTKGVISVNHEIECNGYLQVPDRRTGQMMRIMGTNRCWVASMFKNSIGNVAHHPIPSNAPHIGRPPNGPGFLILPEALERSCNVFFETVADSMHLVGVRDALAAFHLGQRTGIGIPEATGLIPKPQPWAPNATYEPESDRRASWLAGIGQGQVLATPLQMANVAATFARNGVWMRPRLLTGPTASQGLKPAPDDVVDLHLAPDALAAVKEGMIAVVNSRAGTGREPHQENMVVAGKTGSAQTGKFSAPVRDASGEFVRGPAQGNEEKGRVLRIVYEPNDPKLPWYKGVGEERHLAHAWFIGYAPAEHPQVAFCVFVEYGGGGGRVAGAVARELVKACVDQGYLEAPKSAPGKVAAN